MNKVHLWLSESIKRFGLETSPFFQVWQWLGVIAAGIGFLPNALVELNIEVPEFLQGTYTTVLKVAGIIVFLQAKLPVSDPNAPIKNGEVVDSEKALPFTNRKKEAVEIVEETPVQETETVEVTPDKLQQMIDEAVMVAMAKPKRAAVKRAATKSK